MQNISSNAQQNKGIEVGLYGFDVKGKFHYVASGQKLLSTLKPDELNRNSVENLLQLRLMPPTLEFYNQLFVKGGSMTQVEIDKLKLMSVDSIFFILNCKMYISINNKEYCIVKGSLKHTGSKFRACVYVLEKNNDGVWLFTSSPPKLGEYTSMFLTLNSSSLNDILVNKKSSNPFLDQLISASIDRGIVDLTKFYDLLMPILKSKDAKAKEIIEPYLGSRK